MKGNVVDMAVCVVIDGAFGKIVSSFVGDVVMPLLGKIVGGVNFSDLALDLGAGPSGEPVLLSDPEGGASVPMVSYTGDRWVVAWQTATDGRPAVEVVELDGEGVIDTRAVTLPESEWGTGALIGLNSAGQAALLTPFGADTLSVAAGEAAMTDRETAKFTWVAYAVTDAHPPVIKAIWVVNGTMDYTGPESAMSAETLRIYAPESDGNHDGLPDSYDTPLATVPFPPGLNVRVPILP